MNKKPEGYDQPLRENHVEMENNNKKYSNYDVNSYTDQELYDILDIVNPTDRELEAKIHHLIWKYSNFNNESGDKLATFFKDIYHHFFEDSSDEEDDDEQEGMANMAPAQSATTTTSVNDRSYGYSIPIDYSKDTLNPLLKQTVKRIINIDSQYREDKNTPPTNYTFDLSTPLKDVVSLKLYSYNIPYTWYTISKSYGSNFFIIKGNSPGIDNGKYDYKIQIGIGNYLVPDLISNVNTQLQNLRLDPINADVSFGFTGLSYNINSTLSTFTFDISKLYNESYYKLYFTQWSSPNKANASERNTIPAFLGFNFGSSSNNYIPNVVYSTPSFPQISNPPVYPQEDTNVSFYLDSSNNYFDIIQYMDTNYLGYYDPLTSTTFNQNIKIMIPFVDPNTRLKISYTRYSLAQAINKELQDNYYLNPALSKLNRVDIHNTDASNVVIGNGYSQYQMNIQLNRFTTNNTPTSKVVVVFPNDNTIWLSNSSTFRFTKQINELSDIISETNSVKTNYNIATYPTIKFICVNKYFMDISNNYMATIQPSSSAGYLLTDYLKQINDAIISTNTYSIEPTSNPTGIFQTNTIATVDNNSLLFTFNINIVKSFTNYDYFMDVSKSFFNKLGLFKNLSSPDISNNIDLSTKTVNFSYTFTGSTIYSTSGYTVESNDNIMLLKSRKNTANKNAPDINVTIPTGVLLYNNTSDTTQDLKTVLNNIFLTFTDDDNSKILSKTTIDFTIGPDNNLITTLNLNVTKSLTQLDYKIEFGDKNLSFSIENPWTNYNDISGNVNTWYTYLGLDQSYTLSEPSYNKTPSVSYSTIVGNTQISNLDYISINDNNNKIIIEPQITSEGLHTGDNSNSLVITIRPKQNPGYTRDQLISEINYQLNNTKTPNGQSIAKDTIFSTYTDTLSSNIYTKIRFNINKIYTASDYLVNFYDPFTYTSCFSIGKSIQNTTWDSTLGWILGFHNYTQYPLVDAALPDPENPIISTNYPSGTYINPSTHIVTLTGDTSVSTYIYSSFLIVLDDYNQNHMNDGLVTTTQRSTNIPLPSYASRSAHRCEPRNKSAIVSIVSSKSSNTNDNTNPSQLLSTGQIYSAQEILNTQIGVSTQTNTISNSLSNVKSNKRYYSNGPFAKDVFAIVPLKIAGQQQNTPYVDFSGTLQNQERMYFGPVKIQRMTVKLLNDRGEIVDLNNSNWSFSLICEQLYQQRNT
jgi:hypothetical protein